MMNADNLLQTATDVKHHAIQMQLQTKTNKKRENEKQNDQHLLYIVQHDIHRMLPSPSRNLK